MANTIKQALANKDIRRALNGLVGCPEGGWGETRQARQQVASALPWRADRDYTVAQLIDTALTVDHAGRYAWRKHALAIDAARAMEG